MFVSAAAIAIVYLILWKKKALRKKPNKSSPATVQIQEQLTQTAHLKPNNLVPLLN